MVIYFAIDTRIVDFRLVAKSKFIKSDGVDFANKIEIPMRNGNHGEIHLIYECKSNQLNKMQGARVFIV